MSIGISRSVQLAWMDGLVDRVASEKGLGEVGEVRACVWRLGGRRVEKECEKEKDEGGLDQRCLVDPAFSRDPVIPGCAGTMGREARAALVVRWLVVGTAQRGLTAVSTRPLSLTLCEKDDRGGTVVCVGVSQTEDTRAFNRRSERIERKEGEEERERERKLTVGKCVNYTKRRPASRCQLDFLATRTLPGECSRPSPTPSNSAGDSDVAPSPSSLQLKPPPLPQPPQQSSAALRCMRHTTTSFLPFPSCPAFLSLRRRPRRTNVTADSPRGG